MSTPIHLPRMLRTFLALTLLTLPASAQWTLHDAHTTADLRGIDNVGHGIAWASGTDGTILRTEDAGIVWQLCAKPPGGEHLDFRAIQAFDNNTAVIMSIGKGDLSRLYKTIDGCQSWHLLFTNPDKDGFWDALRFNGDVFTILGDPVHDRFALFTVDLFPANAAESPVIHPKPWYGGKTPQPDLQMSQPSPSSQPNSDAVRLHMPFHLEHNPTPLPDEAFFAASNSSYIDTSRSSFAFVSGGPAGARAFVYGCELFHSTIVHCDWTANALPLARSNSAGAFSVATNRTTRKMVLTTAQSIFVAVGGNYTKPNDPAGTAAFTIDGGKTWHAATTPPHGFRSAVAYDSKTKTWITVGPNGTDISTDDGRNWRPLKPDPAFNDTPDGDQHWNALSLPYAVGPHGRIGTLRPSALSPGK